MIDSAENMLTFYSIMTTLSAVIAFGTFVILFFLNLLGFKFSNSDLSDGQRRWGYRLVAAQCLSLTLMFIGEHLVDDQTRYLEGLYREEEARLLEEYEQSLEKEVSDLDVGRAIPAPSDQDALLDLEEQPYRRGSSIGTGFRIDDRTWVTALHVVDTCDEDTIRLTFDEGRSLRATVLYPVGFHDRSAELTGPRSLPDLAVLRSPDTSVPNIPILPIDPKPDALERGQVGVMSGYPGGKPGDVVGVLMGRAQVRGSVVSNGEQNRWYRGREMVSPVVAWAIMAKSSSIQKVGGLSGGPVFDGSGDVIGVVSAGNHTVSVRRGRIFTVAPATVGAALGSLDGFADEGPSDDPVFGGEYRPDYDRIWSAIEDQVSRLLSGSALKGMSLSPGDGFALGDKLRKEKVVSKIVCRNAF